MTAFPVEIHNSCTGVLALQEGCGPSCKALRIYRLRLMARKVLGWIFQTNEQISRGLHRLRLDVRFLFSYTLKHVPGTVSTQDVRCRLQEMPPGRPDRCE